MENFVKYNRPIIKQEIYKLLTCKHSLRNFAILTLRYIENVDYLDIVRLISKMAFKLAKKLKIEGNCIGQVDNFYKIGNNNYVVIKLTMI